MRYLELPPERHRVLPALREPGAGMRLNAYELALVREAMRTA